MDNEEVTHTSWFERMCGSIMCAIIGAPLLGLCAMMVLGWNENRAVCEWNAINSGEAEVVNVGCDKATGDGKLVLLRCDIQKDGLETLSFPGDFAHLSFQGTGFTMKAEMLQCVEHSSSQTKKDKLGGGSTTTTTYTYSTEWRSAYVDDSSFTKKDSGNFKENCGTSNPSFPRGIPDPSRRTQRAKSVKVGAYGLSRGFINLIPVTARLSFDNKESPVPTGWSESGGIYEKKAGKENGIGDVRVSFFGNDWTKPMLTVLGKNTDSVISSWTAPDSWLCSGNKLGEVWPGKRESAQVFDGMRQSSQALTYVLRIVGWILFWVGFAMCFGPLEVAVDFIPCIGPYLGDAIATITCAISCVPGTACCLFVIAIVWVVMRPWVGIPLLIVAGILVGVMIYYRNKYPGKAVENRE